MSLQICSLMSTHTPIFLLQLLCTSGLFYTTGIQLTKFHCRCTVTNIYHNWIFTFIFRHIYKMLLRISKSNHSLINTAVKTEGLTLVCTVRLIYSTSGPGPSTLEQTRALLTHQHTLLRMVQKWQHKEISSVSISRVFSGFWRAPRCVSG